MSATIVELGAHHRMTVDEALQLSLRESPKKVVILFIDHADNFGLRSSGISREEALWLSKQGEKWILGT